MANINEPISPIKVVNLGQPRVVLSPKYQNELNKVPTLVSKANQWLNNVDVTKLDENQISELRKRLRKVTHLKNSINQGLKDNRRFWNNLRDKSQSLFENKMKAYHLDDLNALGQKATRVNRQILDNRANRRWHALKPVFDKNIQIHPIIQKYAPQLTSFSRFRIMNTNLVSRAKSKPLTNKHKEFISNTLNQWATNIKLIADNPFNLTAKGQYQILNSLIQDPSDNAGNTITLRMKDYKAKEDEIAKRAKIRQQQVLKQQQQAKNQQNQSQSTKQNKPNKPKSAIHPTNDPYQWLSDYIQSNPRLQQIYQNDHDKFKTDMIIIASQNSFEPNNFWSEHVKKDPHYFVKLISYIISL